MRVLCNAPQQCAACTSADPATRVAALGEYVAANLKNREVLDLVTKTAEVDKATRDAQFREAATQAGLPNCPLVDGDR